MENFKEEFELGKEESVVKARVKAFRDDGDNLRANQTEAEFKTKTAKRESERVAAMSWEEKGFAAEDLPKLANEQKLEYENETDPERKEKKKKNWERSVRRNMALQTALTSEGIEAAQWADKKAAEAIGWGDEDGPLDDANRPRFELSKILGRKISKNEIGSAQKEVYAAFGGEDKAQGALTLYSNAQKVAGMQGAGNRMGLVASARNKETGQLERSFADSVALDGGDYAISEAPVDHTKWATAAGYSRTDTSGSIVGISTDRAEQLAGIFKGRDQIFVGKMQNSFFQSLNKVKITDKNKGEFKYFIDQIGGVLKDRDARAKFNERASDLLNNLGMKLE